MQGEFVELLEIAIYKEVASQAFYEAGQNRTDDPGARALMRELADAALRHTQMLKELGERQWKGDEWARDKIPNLMISEHLTDRDKLEGASLQDTLLFAMKREQQALEFYSHMMSALRDKDAKLLCQKLAHDELKHKLKLETLYDDLFYQED
jgi:rubrerythrin